MAGGISQETKDLGILSSAYGGNLGVYGLEEKLDKNLVMADDAVRI